MMPKRGLESTMKKGFDNDLYIRQQSEHIRQRIDQFGGKLYLEFGGKTLRKVGWAVTSASRMMKRCSV